MPKPTPLQTRHVHLPSARSIKTLLILLAICTILLLWPHLSLPFDLDSLTTSPTPPTGKYAFATILTGEDDTDTDSSSSNPYFTAARLLTYQLLHDPDTRSESDIPFLILVTDNVPQTQRDQLTRDGATVVPVESIGRDWVQPKWARWSDVLAKLNIFTMTAYEKITFLDADSMLFSAIDGIFTHEGTEIQRTRGAEFSPGSNSPDTDNHGEGEREREGEELPESYLLAGIHDHWVETNLPPDPTKPGGDFYLRDHYMNAGFFTLAPSEKLFGYYLSLLDKPGAFDPNYPEQNLLNCAHRVDGRMPWRDLGESWSRKGASRADYEGGLKSVHQKWWVKMGDEILDGFVANLTARMGEFYAERYV
ncbi:nucleotide-diphospho-sugar transferase [Aspergillus egyptiacus]|nr:nucleotide-diphospho-sugar transferase [Aspergillus egyptiacus]